jgi:hypothetical protein
MPPHIQLRDNFFLVWKLGDSYMFVLLGVRVEAREKEASKGKEWVPTIFSSRKNNNILGS